MTLFIVLISYLIGVLPTGKIIARLYGVKIESVGSGNVGATNVARSVGKKAGLLTLLIDVAKGFSAVLLAEQFGANPEIQALSGLCVVCGHCFSIPRVLKGGKGIATSLGVFIAVAPYVAVITVTIFAVFFLVTRIVSIGSLAAALSVLIIGIYNSGSHYGLSFALLAIIVITKHIPNIKRVLNGTEAKF